MLRGEQTKFSFSRIFLKSTIFYTTTQQQQQHNNTITQQQQQLFPNIEMSQTAHKTALRLV
jgi:hypothetical protein